MERLLCPSCGAALILQENETLMPAPQTAEEIAEQPTVEPVAPVTEPVEPAAPVEPQPTE